jgi:hypothetical protein
MAAMQQAEESSSEPVKLSYCGSLYARVCYFVPLACMMFMTGAFFSLCIADRPLALAWLTVYMIHHAWCVRVYGMMLRAFSLIV